jgi:tetratricopeptide (TPR) repeat protein
MRWILAGLFMLLIGSGLQAQRTLAKADQHFEVCEFRQALENYQALLDKSDNDPRIIAHIAMCYEAMGDNLLAVQWYEKIIEREDIAPEYLLQYAQLLKRLNLQGKAKYYFLKYAQYAPTEGRHFAASCDFARAEQKVESEYEIEITAFNSEYGDFSPAIFRDELVFASFRTDIIEKAFSGAKQKPDLSGNQLYRISMNDQARSPQPLSTELNNLTGVGPFHYSANGKWVVFSRNKWQNGHRLFQDCENMSIYIGSVLPDGQWQDVHAFPHNDNEFANAYPCMSEDGSILYFASNRPGGFGGFDIWGSFRTHDGWSKPENLGPVINSPGNEITPYFIGKTLFFASDYHTGLGGFDIFKAMSGHGQWNQIFHLGAGINSERDDFSYVCSDSDGPAYFVSDRVSGLGKADIYRAIPTFREVMVQVLDQSTDMAVPEASIRFAGSERYILTNTFGKAVVHQPLEEEKEIIVTKAGYQDLLMTLTDGTGDVKPKEYRIYLQKMTEQMLAMAEKEKAKVQQEQTGSMKENVTPESVAMQTGNNSIGNVVSPNSRTVDSGNISDQSVPNASVNAPGSKPARDMFAVQVAAISTSNVDLSNYGSLNDYGRLVTSEEGKMTKLRVGYFDSKDEANRKLIQIRAAGYSDAFLVVIPGKNIEQAQKREADAGNDEARYKVRLATYSDPGNFNPTGITGLGEIQSYTKNAYTIMLLGGFSSREEAEQARRIANANGFPDAYVVIDKNGVLHKAN